MTMQGQLQADSGNADTTKRAQVTRFLIGALVIAALGWLALQIVATETKPRLLYPEHLESVTPENSSQNVPGQASIVANLEFGYTGALIINGREIPMDQVDEVVATGELRFSPGDGKDLRRLPGGALSVTVVFWPSQGTREVDADSYSWVLNVN